VAEFFLALQGTISLAVFEELRAKWGDRLILQAASLVSLDYLLTPAGEKFADKMAEINGIFGGVAYINLDKVHNTYPRLSTNFYFLLFSSFFFLSVFAVRSKKNLFN
jgi:hypothetical protein